MKGWRKFGWFVVQDKATAVPCRRSGDFASEPPAFSRLEDAMWSRLYSTASGPAGSLAQRVELRKLEGARSPLAAFAAAAVIAAFLIAAGESFGILISVTDSAAAAGVYRVTSAEPFRGELVAACLPAEVAQFGLARGYLRTGGCPGDAEPVAKILGAHAGDAVEIEPGFVAVNGRLLANSATATRDSAGRPLSHVPWGRYRVAKGQVWVFGFNNWRSWDSRYFGPVPAANVRGSLEPVLTW
jgi:conjugative transfer signal peptidase TraF